MNFRRIQKRQIIKKFKHNDEFKAEFKKQIAEFKKKAEFKR